MRPTVVISGAGIAGPVLAHWLHRYGFTPTVVERSSTVRTTGYPVDVRGAAVDVIEKMGLLPDLRALRTTGGHVAFVDTHGRPRVRLPADVLTGSTTGRDLEVPRAALTALLQAYTRDHVAYAFDDSITAIAQSDDGVHLTFARGRPRTVDVLVGADGLHSRTRSLVFGPEERYRHDLGYYFAGFSVDARQLPAETQLFNAPGRLAGWYAADSTERRTAVLAFAAARGAAHPVHPDDTSPDRQRDLLAQVFAGDGWAVPWLLEQMRTADDLFVDSVSQIRMPAWCAGRTALVGDAAYAPALLSGQGTTLAIVGAFVLAGELARYRDDPARAWPAYENTLRRFVARNQAIARRGRSLLIPRTPTGIRLRNGLLGALPLLGPATRLVDGSSHRAASSLVLPPYTPR